MTDFLSELREELLDGLERYERAPWWRRPPRIGLVTRRTAAVAVAVAVAVAALVLATHRPADLEQSTTPPVTRLEGFHASGLVAANGSLWVTEYNTSSLLRIDLQTGTIRSRIDVGGSPGTVIAVHGMVWVHDWQLGRLVEVDPRTNRVTRTLHLSVKTGDIAYGGGAVWASGASGILFRIDPDTGTVTRRVPLDRQASSIAPTLAVSGDTLWLAAGSAVTELDARSGRILGRAQGPWLPTEFARRTAADASGLWIASPTRREVVHIDARTRRLTRYPVGGDPSSLALVEGRIWVATLHETDPLTRVSVLDSDGRLVAAVPVPHPVVGIAAAENGGVWVTFGEDGTVSPAAVHLSVP